MKMFLTVYASGSVCFEIDYGGIVDGRRNTAVYSFADWKHFIGHFGGILPLTNCRIYVSVAEND